MQPARTVREPRLRDAPLAAEGVTVTSIGWAGHERTVAVIAERTDHTAGPNLDRSDDLQVGIAMAMVGFYVASMGSVLAILATEFGVAPQSLSWVGSTFGVGLVVVAALGRLVLRPGAQVALAASALTLGIGALLVAVAPSLVLVFVGAVLQGLGAAVMVLVAPVILAESADIRLTKVNAVASLVGVAAPVLLGVAAGLGIGGRLPLLILVPMLAWLLWLLLRQRPTASGPTGPTMPDTAPPATTPATRPRRRTALRRWLAVVMAVSVEFCYVVWGVSRLRDAGLDTSLAAIVGIAFPVGMTAGRFVGPWVIRRLPAVLFGATVAVVGTLLVVVGSHWWLVAAGLVTAGVGVATLYPVTLSSLMATPRLNPAHGASLGALASGTAIVSAPVVLAAVASQVDLRWAFLVPIPLLLLLLGLHGSPPRRDPRPTSR